MTIASRLLLTRRARRSEDSPASSSDQDPSNKGCHGRHGRREYCHLCRPRSGARRPSRRPAALLDRDWAIQLEHRTSSGLGISTSNSRVILRSSSFRNERLPSSVLEARERLLDRLQNLSLTRNGTGGAHASSLEQQQSANTEFSTMVSGFSSDRVSAKDAIVFLWKDICSQYVVVYSGIEAAGVEDETPWQHECPICLESFQAGDKLVQLRCLHKFHPNCLEPWIWSCGDCPYCRASVV